MIYYLFFFGVALSIVFFIVGIIKKKKNFLSTVLPFSLTFTVMFVILAVFIYSTIINPKGSLFVPRYFILILPQMILLSGFVLGRMTYFIHKQMKSRTVVQICAVLCCFIALIGGVKTVTAVKTSEITIHEPFRESADWVMSRSEIYSPKTAIILTNSKIVTDGFNDYYISQKGQRDHVNVFSQTEIAKEFDIILDYETLYFVSYHSKLSADMKEFLASNYKDVDINCDYNISKYTQIKD